MECRYVTDSARFSTSRLDLILAQPQTE
jgi:hypothetical protein